MTPNHRCLGLALAAVTMIGAVVSPVTSAGRAGAATADTTISTIAGTGAGTYSGDGGPASAAGLQRPTGVAVDSAGNTYVADSVNQLIRRIDASGMIVTIAGTGASPLFGDGGPATAANLASPKGVAVDSAGNVYVAEAGNQRVRRIDRAGTISTIAGIGTGPGSGGFSGDGGPATAAKLSSPTGVAVDANGSVFVADTGNDRIRRIDATGVITTVAGGGTAGLGDGGPATKAGLIKPTLAISDGAGGLYIADAGDNLVRHVDSGGRISTFAGGGIATGEGIVATSASLALAGSVLVPGLALDPNGDLYLSDAASHRIRRVSPDGRIFTFAGNGAANYSGDGASAVGAGINFPAGLAVATSGRLLIADSANNRVRAVQAPPLAIDDVSVAEGNSGTTTATFSVTVRDNTRQFDVSYATADGTATAADHDYLPTSGTIHFGPGDWRKTLSVQVVGDTAPELDETFSVHLSHSPYPDATGTATVVNDDGPVPVLSIPDTSVVEGDTGTTTIATFTVTKTGQTTIPVSVDYATADGTGTAPADYIPASGTITFGPTETSKTFGVVVVGDELKEGDEAFVAKLSNPHDAVIATSDVPPPGKPLDPPVHVTLDTATATIIDDDVAGWTPTSSLGACSPAGTSCTGRDYGTATSLWAPECTAAEPPTWCGKVLVAGGLDLGTRTAVASAELYDPISATWGPTGSMLLGRYMHTATLLADGGVLVVGGVDPALRGIQEAELYDPGSGTWAVTSPPAFPRTHNSATLLGDGSVLVSGGTDNQNVQPATDSVELFDPVTGRWSNCSTSDAHAGCPAPLPEPRLHHTAVRLPDGRVLVAGGLGSGVTIPPSVGVPATTALPPLASAVIYDPSTGRWRAAAPMATARSFPAGALVAAAPCGDECGRVLVVAGGPTPSAEFYDPVADRWSPAARPAFEPTVGHFPQDFTVPDALTPMPDGRLVLIDFQDGASDVYDPALSLWSVGRADAGIGPGFAAARLDRPECRRSGPPWFCDSLFATSGAHGAVFTPSPTVEGLGPVTGPSSGGTKVVISGRGFPGASVVKFGDVPATDVHVDSPRQLTATAPSQPSGPVEVSVRTPAGGTSRHLPADLSVPFTYSVSQAPAAVADLSAHPASGGKLFLSWSAPASDGAYPPPAAKYVVKVSKSPIADGASFSAAPALCGGTCGFNAPNVGAPLGLSVDGLDPGTTYHFALRAVNEAGQSGHVSNDAIATTVGAARTVATAAVPTTTRVAPVLTPVTSAAPAPASAVPADSGASASSPAAPASGPATAPAAAPATPTAGAAPAPSAAPVQAAATTSTAPAAPRPATTLPPESALGQSVSASPVLQTKDAVPSWSWVLLALSVAANLTTAGTVFRRRLPRRA